jgi:hypothetical protein
MRALAAFACLTTKASSALATMSREGSLCGSRGIALRSRFRTAGNSTIRSGKPPSAQNSASHRATSSLEMVLSCRMNFKIPPEADSLHARLRALPSRAPP